MAEDMRRMQGQPVMRTDMNQNGMGGQPIMQPKGGSKAPWVVLVVVIIVLAVFGFLFRDRLFGASSDGEVKGEVTSAEESGYQAVFLTNGQVYFGKVSDMNDAYATLNDIYYLQVTNPPLQGEGAQNQQQQILLVKLGNELHGPVDEMKINRDQILFVEDMKEESQVMQKIREYQKDPQGATRQQPQTQAPATTQPTVNGQNTTTPSTNTGTGTQQNTGNTNTNR